MQQTLLEDIGQTGERIVGNGTQRQPSQASWKEALQDISQTLFLTYLTKPSGNP